MKKNLVLISCINHVYAADEATNSSGSEELTGHRSKRKRPVEWIAKTDFGSNSQYRQLSQHFQRANRVAPHSRRVAPI